jgi:hypothetical protein
MCVCIMHAYVCAYIYIYMCVYHLNRCKTSALTSFYIPGISFFNLQGAQAHCGYLCQRSYSTMGEAEIDHLRVPALLTVMARG